MPKMMISLGRKTVYDRKKAETGFEVPYVYELVGPDGAHFHFWVPVNCVSSYPKQLAEKMYKERDVWTYSWDVDPELEPPSAGVLVLDNENEESDYILKEDANSVWITVGDISVYVLKTPDGVEVAMYPHLQEADADPIGVAWAPYSAIEGRYKE